MNKKKEGKRLNILFVTPSFPPMIGGGERYAQRLAHELIKRGHGITVVTTDIREQQDFWRRRPNARPRETNSQGLRIIRCRATGLLGGRLALLAQRKALIVASSVPLIPLHTLRRMADRFPRIPDLGHALNTLPTVDLVHAFNISWESTALAGEAFARSHNVPFVITPFAHLGAKASDRVARNHTMRHQLALLNAADAVLCLSYAERESLTRVLARKDHLYITGAGVDPPEKCDDNRQVLAMLGIRQPYVLFLGRISRDKGVHVFIDAAKRLARSSRDYLFILAGQATPRAIRRLSRLSPDLGIRYIGTVDELTKEHLLTGCEVLVLPSRVESLGMVILEAWMHGKAVIGARAGGLRSVITDGVNGLLVPFGDAEALAAAIDRLLRSPELRSRFGAAGKRHVERTCNWGQVVDRLLNVYNSVLFRPST